MKSDRNQQFNWSMPTSLISTFLANFIREDFRRELTLEGKENTVKFKLLHNGCIDSFVDKINDVRCNESLA